MRARSEAFSISAVRQSFHSALLFAKSPVSPWITVLRNSAVGEQIEGTLTIAASKYLMLDFASLKTLFSRGAMLMSHLARRVR
ncbi:hypothetical protein BEN78_03340 [Xanthomonas citri pv. mangiferaeindicae]|nr:hypothetical protein BEN78_03340 [Xanthomonas citri pv. mangiferaeindicae]